MVDKYRLAPEVPFNLTKQMIINFVVLLFVLMFFDPLPWYAFAILGGIWFGVVVYWDLSRARAMRRFWRLVARTKESTGIDAELAEEMVFRFWNLGGKRRMVRNDVGNENNQ
jgi:hypothetical protein